MPSAILSQPDEDGSTNTSGPATNSASASGLASGSSSGSGSTRSRQDPSGNTANGNGMKFKFTEIHHVLKLRLGPLRRVQKDLERRLGSGSEEAHSVGGLGVTVAAPFDNGGLGNGSGNGNVNGNGNTNGNGNPYYTNGASEWAYQPNGMPSRHPQEFFVRSSTGWKSALEK